MEKEVLDPTTGEMVTAPEYGVTFIFPIRLEPQHTDTMYSHVPGLDISGVAEKLGIGNWGIDRDEFGFSSQYIAISAITGGLAESWEQPDPATYVFKIRPGVHWHDKAPMNGRALTAKDIEYNYHRYLALGSGFTEPSPWELSGISNSRVVRSAVIGIKENDYFLAAHATGSPTGPTLLRHVLPNIMAPIIVIFSITVGGIIVAEASLSSSDSVCRPRSRAGVACSAGRGAGTWR